MKWNMESEDFTIVQTDHFSSLSFECSKTVELTLISDHNVKCTVCTSAITWAKLTANW